MAENAEQSQQDKGSCYEDCYVRQQEQQESIDLLRKQLECAALTGHSFRVAGSGTNRHQLRCADCWLTITP